MATVSVKIGSKQYQLACDDGQEEHLRLLADDVDDRVRALLSRMGGGAGDQMGLLLASITMADELIENKKEITRLSSEVKQLLAIIDDEGGERPDLTHEDEPIEEAVVSTLEEIAQRIEKIAERMEMR